MADQWTMILPTTTSTTTARNRAWKHRHHTPRSSYKPLMEARGVWSTDEHARFIQGIRMFPAGPWKDIAAFVGTRTARQTMTHAQKYRQKVARRLRTLRASDDPSAPTSLMHSPRYAPLLSTENDQLSDSILSTSLAITAEKELNTLTNEPELSRSRSASFVVDPPSPVSEVPDEFSSLASVPSMLDLLQMPAEAFMTPDQQASCDMLGANDPEHDAEEEFGRCMDFLIELFGLP